MKTINNHILKKYLRRIIKLLPAGIICKLEFNRQTFIGFNERPLEFGFLFKAIGTLCPKKVLDVGTGTTALPHLIRNCGPTVTAIDNIKDFWPSGMSNRHYHVIDRDITSFKKLKFNDKFDLITCISVLEHITDHNKAIQNMFSLLNEGGHLIITCPYTENNYNENVYLLPESHSFRKSVPYVCQSYSRENLNTWLSENGGRIIDQEFWQCWSGEYWSTRDQIIPPLKVDSKNNHQLTCILIKKEHII